MNYPLSDGRTSPYCRGRWDDQNQKFLNSSSMDIISCCLDSCQRHVHYCFDQCEKSYGPRGKKADFWQYSRCRQQCDQLADNCQSGCEEINSEGLKIITACAKKMCGDDQECLKNNRDAIISCCNTSCDNNQSTDCNHDFCGSFYDHLLKGTHLLTKPAQIDQGMFPSGRDRTLVYLAIIVISILLCLYAVHALRK